MPKIQIDMGHHVTDTPEDASTFIFAGYWTITTN